MLTFHFILSHSQFYLKRCSYNDDDERDAKTKSLNMLRSHGRIRYGCRGYCTPARRGIKKGYRKRRKVGRRRRRRWSSLSPTQKLKPSIFIQAKKNLKIRLKKDFAALDLECEKHLCRNSYYDIKAWKIATTTQQAWFSWEAKWAFMALCDIFRFCWLIQQTKKKLRNGLVSHACSDYAKNCIHITQWGLVVIHHFRLLPQFDHQLVDYITPFWL